MTRKAHEVRAYACTHTHTHTSIFAHKHAHMHTCTCARMHSCTQACMYAHTHAETQTETHRDGDTETQKHIDTETQRHTQSHPAILYSRKPRGRWRSTIISAPTFKQLADRRFKGSPNLADPRGVTARALCTIGPEVVQQPCQR